jgi:hypothetical protein
MTPRVEDKVRLRTGRRHLVAASGVLFALLGVAMLTATSDPSSRVTGGFILVFGLVVALSLEQSGVVASPSGCVERREFWIRRRVPQSDIKRVVMVEGAAGMLPGVIPKLELNSGALLPLKTIATVSFSAKGDQKGLSRCELLANVLGVELDVPLRR